MVASDTYQKWLRGQVWWYVEGDGEPVSSVQMGTRPVLIVSNNDSNANLSTVNVIPLTTREKEVVPSHVTYQYNGRNQTLLCEQVKTIANKHLKNYEYTLSDQMMQKVNRAIMATMGIEIQGEEDESGGNE